MTTAENKKLYPSDEEEKKFEQEILDAIKKVPIEQRFQLIALNNLILQKKQLDKDMEEEMEVIVKKYSKLTHPINEKSFNLVQGKHQAGDPEIEKIKQHLSEDEVAKIKESLTQEPIPEYWVKVFKNCVQLSQDVFEADYAILKHLQKIEHHEEEGTDNYSLKFIFGPNEYFENEALTVRFVMLSENEVDKIEGTDIKWKEGKDITKKSVTKKQKNKKTGKTRSVTKTVDADSFFNFFKSLQATPGKDGNEEEDEDDETLEKLDIHLDISRTMIDEIIPYHLEFFLGVREDEMGGDVDDDEDLDDEDDDDEDDAPKGKKGKGGDSSSDSDTAKKSKKKKF